MAEGYQDRMDTQMHLLAWHAANTMNVHLKTKVTIQKLLGNRGKRKEMTPLEMEAEAAKFNRILAERRESSNG